MESPGGLSVVIWRWSVDLVDMQQGDIVDYFGDIGIVLSEECPNHGGVIRVFSTEQNKVCWFVWAECRILNESR